MERLPRRGDVGQRDERGATGAVSAANSLVGSTANDQVGSGGVTVLNNGNYVARSPLWDNGAAVDAGAVCLGDGTLGTTGAVCCGQQRPRHGVRRRKFNGRRL